MMSKSSQSKVRWDELFAFQNEDEHLDFLASTLSGSIAYKIEQILDNRGMTKKELAEKIGTSTGYITQIIAGDKLITMKFLAKLKLYLDIDFLIELVDKGKVPSID